MLFKNVDNVLDVRVHVNVLLLLAREMFRTNPKIRNYRATSKQHPDCRLLDIDPSFHLFLLAEVDYVRNNSDRL